jgi:hypothetical protein
LTNDTSSKVLLTTTTACNYYWSVEADDCTVALRKQSLLSPPPPTAAAACCSVVLTTTTTTSLTSESTELRTAVATIDREALAGNRNDVGSQTMLATNPRNGSIVRNNVLFDTFCISIGAALRSTFRARSDRVGDSSVDRRDNFKSSDEI